MSLFYEDFVDVCECTPDSKCFISEKYVGFFYILVLLKIDRPLRRKL